MYGLFMVLFLVRVFSRLNYTHFTHSRDIAIYTGQYTHPLSLIEPKVNAQIGSGSMVTTTCDVILENPAYGGTLRHQIRLCHKWVSTEKKSRFLHNFKTMSCR